MTPYSDLWTIVQNTLYLFLIFTFPLFWVAVLIKKLCFWVWLWQIKEYHSKRFLAHFSTFKGKKLILNWQNALKLFSIYAFIKPFPWDWLIIVIIFLFSIYFLEFASALRHLLQRNLRYPVLTKKTALILTAGFLLIISFFFGLFLYDLSWRQFFLGILIFDLFSPLIFSILVFCFWPITFLWQKRLIKRAKKKREKFKDLLVVGITGSYGKTSTKEFLYTILVSKYGKEKILKTRKNQNSEVGISRCILNDLKPEHKIFICEMGAYNRGGIKLLCEIARPKIGILTGINEQHLATFGSQNNTILAKFELIQSLPENGLAILNRSDSKIKSQISNLKNAPYQSRLGAGQANQKLKNIKFCSITEKTDVWAEDLKIEKRKISFKAFSKDGDEAFFEVNLIGEHNIENLLMAICCAKELGMSLEEISRACQEIMPLERTMTLKKGIRGVMIIDDSYSANPRGVMAALDYLKLYPGYKIIIMPCLIELGRASKRVHQKIGKKIGQACDLAIITTRDRFKEIKNGAIQSGMKEKQILFLENPKMIFEKIKPYCRPENIILLESRVSKELVKLLLK